MSDVDRLTVVVAVGILIVAGSLPERDASPSLALATVIQFGLLALMILQALGLLP